MEIINSIVDGNEVAVEFKVHFLSNEIRARIIAIDAKYMKLSRKFTKAEKKHFSSAEAFASKISEVELSGKSDKEKEKEIDLLMKEYEEYHQESWELVDNKYKELLQLITRDVSRLELYQNSEFWKNADMGKVQEIVNNFRTNHRI